MPDLIIPSQHISFISASDIKQVCQPLFTRYGMNCFSYSRIYKDGSRGELWSDSQALEDTFFTKKYIVGAYTPNYFLPEEKYILLRNKLDSYPSKWKTKFIQQLSDQREYFDHDHCFMILNKGQEYTEYFIFYAPAKMYNIVNFYLNNLDLFDNFTHYFRLSVPNLITAIDQHRLIPSSFTNKLAEERVFQGRGSQASGLTVREIQIAKLMLEGKTAREISTLLHRSLRTIEVHIDHIKFKLKCSKRSELIAAFLKMGLFDTSYFAAPVSIKNEN